SRRHALMRSLYYHTHSMWLQDAVQTVRYFGSHFFLNLKTFRVDIDEMCKLRNSDDSIPGKIANVNASDDRRHVVCSGIQIGYLAAARFRRTHPPLRRFG